MKPQILIVDDRASDRKIVSDILDANGYSWLPAADGEEAIEMTKKHGPELLVLDGLLPKVSGFDVANAVKRLPNPPRVIILTGVYTDARFRRISRADAFLTKPPSSKQLLDLIRQFIGPPKTPADE